MEPGVGGTAGSDPEGLVVSQHDVDGVAADIRS